jgi:hypothetical protein
MSINELPFQTVPNTLRETLPPVRSRQPSDLVKRLLNDETLFIPISDDLNENALNKFYPRAKVYGYKFNKRKTTLENVQGFMIWFTKPEPEEEGATSG